MQLHVSAMVMLSVVGDEPVIFWGSLENMNAICSEAEVTCLQVSVGGNLFFENYLLIGWFM
jgi:hypothetical protein